MRRQPFISAIIDTRKMAIQLVLDQRPGYGSTDVTVAFDELDV